MVLVVLPVMVLVMLRAMLPVMVEEKTFAIRVDFVFATEIRE